MKKKITAIFLCVALVAVAVVGASLAYFTDTTEAKTNTFTMGGVDITLAEPKWNEQVAHTLVPGKFFAKDPTITVAEGSEDSYVYLELSFNKYNSLLWVMAADASADETTNALKDFTIFDNEGKLLPTYKNSQGAFSSEAFLKAMQTNKAVFQAIVNKWFKGIAHEDWEIVETPSADGTNLTVKLAYIGGEKNGVLKAGNAVTFMRAFGMPASVTQEMIDAGTTDGGMENAFNTEKAPLNLTFKAYAVQAQGFDTAKAAWDATFGA